MKINEFFNKGFYINLDRRLDRKQQFENEVSKVGLLDFFERFSAHDGSHETDPMKRHYYCGSSYINLFRKILNEGYEKVLIFEDDIVFYNEGSKPAIQIMEQALDEIQNFSDWDLLYFGGHPSEILYKVSDILSIPQGVLTTHAVGYTRKGIEKIIKYKPFSDSAIDGWISVRPQIRKYITNELAISQSDGDSDLDASGKSVGPFGFANSYKNIKFRPAKTSSSCYLENNYIVPRLQGRTGNMMFQIANAYVKALEYDRQIVVPYAESSSSHLEKGLFRNFNFRIDKIPDNNKSKHIWSSFNYNKVSDPDNDIPTVYCGWYQSEKFFENYKSVIRDVFSPTQEFINKAFNDYPFLKTYQVAAINIRRGDYLTQPRRHPVVSHSYIDKAISKLPYHDIKLIVSDDIQWCKNNMRYENMIFAENYYDQNALWLLSLCDHFVISNSTFSWWGAWLSRNKEKVVIAPSIWFGPDVEENSQDIYCENWTKIDTKYDDGYIVC